MWHPCYNVFPRLLWCPLTLIPASRMLSHCYRPGDVSLKVPINRGLMFFYGLLQLTCDDKNCWLLPAAHHQFFFFFKPSDLFLPVSQSCPVSSEKHTADAAVKLHFNDLTRCGPASHYLCACKVFEPCTSKSTAAHSCTIPAPTKRSLSPHNVFLSALHQQAID